MRRAGFLFFLVVVGCSRAPAPPLDAKLIGASAMEALPDGGARWFYDAPSTPTVVVRGADAVELRWERSADSPRSFQVPAQREADRPTDGSRSEPPQLESDRPRSEPSSQATVTARRVTPRGNAYALARPPVGAYRLTVVAGASRATFDVLLRPSTSELVERFEELATNEPTIVEAELAALPPSAWPWACVGVARASPPTARVDAYLRCSDGAGERGFESERISRRIAAVFWARRQGSWARARTLLAELERELETFDDPRLRSQFHYQQGLFHADLGDVRAAASVFEVAIGEAELAERPDEVALYRASHAVTLSEAGRHDAALELARQLDSAEVEGLSVDDRLALRSNVTWVRLRALAQGSSLDTAALRTELRTLDELVRGSRQQYRPTVLANLAFLEFQQGNLDLAMRTVAVARTQTPESFSSELTFLDWLEGRVALRRRDGKAAAAAFEAMLRRAERATPGLFTDATWRAQLGRAEAALLAGRAKAASTALNEARRSLAGQARAFVEPGERMVFFEDRRLAVAEAVERFAEAGGCDEAFRLADDGQAWLARSFESDRRVRLGAVSEEVRAHFERDEEAYAHEREALLAEEAPRLASVAELEAWKVKRQAAMVRLRERAAALSAVLEGATVSSKQAFEASALQGDEALLEVFQTPSSKRAFLVRRGTVACLPSPDALEGQLTGVRHLFVVDGGLALWPSDGLAKVLETSTLSFLPSAQWLHQARVDRGRGVLVVGDARFDLPHARAEARQVTQVLDGELLLGDEATLAAVTSRWSGKSVFHFAGHGRLSLSTPWEARLELAKGQQLDFELLVSKRPTPWLVVLSGCETGATQRAPADAIGLAEGFLAGGSHTVLATTFELEDARAGQFVERFYRLGGAVNPPEAYRRAVLEAIAANDDGWKMWKLFGHRSS